MIAISPSIPVTIITGYLGSGKTTLLNRLLTHKHGRKVAAIVNEFGDVGIDSQLVMNADEEILEMNNGCICCTVRGDLIRIVSNLLEKQEKFDYLVIETTGLADPAPVIQSFFVDEIMRSKTELDAVVTVVDAKHIWDRWDSSEAQEQIAFADVILLNKIDLVLPEQVDLLEKRIRARNAIAKIYRTQNCDLIIDSILGVKAFDLKNALSIDPEFLSEDAHEHDETISSVSIKVLQEFGLDIPESTRVDVWDTSAQIRWFVLPERPAGTEGWTEEQLAAIVTPEAMQGAAKVVVPA
jgi:G3E family GTPase